MAQGTGVAPVLARLAGHGLPGEQRPVVGAPVPPERWPAVLDGVVDERLSGLLVRAAADGAFPLTDEQHRQASAAHRGAMFTTLFLESSMLGLLDVLAGRGIEARVLKGSSAARLAYPDASLRPFIDIDLLVPSAHFDRALSVVEGEGGRRRFPEPHPGFDRRFGKAATLVMPEGFEVDLHRTLVTGPYAHIIPVADLFATCTTFEVAGRPVRTLGAEERFLHACFHALLGTAPARLIPLRDVAQLALTANLDNDRILELAARWRGRAVVARAVELAWTTLGVGADHPLVDWARAYRPGRGEHQRLAAYREGASYASQVLVGLRDVRGAGAKVAYLRALAVPDSSYLEGRYASQLGRWRQGAAATWKWVRSTR